MKAQLKNKDTLFQVFSYEGKIINVPNPVTHCDLGKNQLEKISDTNSCTGESELRSRLEVEI